MTIYQLFLKSLLLKSAQQQQGYRLPQFVTSYQPADIFYGQRPHVKTPGVPRVPISADLDIAGEFHPAMYGSLAARTPTLAVPEEQLEAPADAQAEQAQPDNQPQQAQPGNQPQQAQPEQPAQPQQQPQGQSKSEQGEQKKTGSFMSQW